MLIICAAPQGDQGNPCPNICIGQEIRAASSPLPLCKKHSRSMEETG